MSIQVSEWDTKHFGFKIAQLPHANDKSNITKGIQEAISKSVKLLISRCPTDSFGWISELERREFRLMDTLIYYVINLTEHTLLERRYIARAATGKDKESVIQIAEMSFKEYVSHYSADPRLDRHKCRELYTQWAINSFNDRKLADQILVTEIDKIVTAFLVIKIKDKGNTGEVMLTAVHPDARRKGVYKDIVAHAAHWGKERGCSKIETPTQITNIFVQKAWASMGGTIDRSYYTFHLWI